MSKDPDTQLQLAGFRLRVVRRQFPDATDFWDANWLVVDCECEAPGAHVRAAGPFVHLSGIDDLARALERLHAGRSHQEIEPQLSMKFKTGARGDMEFEVGLTPNHLRQTHRFSFDIDLSSLQSAIAQCRSILVTYPIRFAPKI